MFSQLFVNACALGGGIFIGFQRAKEMYFTYTIRKEHELREALRVVITEAILSELKEEYEKHKHNPESTFVFRGEQMLVSYAKYLIEFLEEVFADVKRQEDNRTKKHN